MPQTQNENTGTRHVFEVHSTDVRHVRPYYGTRLIVFLTCVGICMAALLPAGVLSNGPASILSGLVLLAGYILVYRFSRPVVAASFAFLKWRRSILVWNSLGLFAGLAYAANGWDILGDHVTAPIFVAAGTVFFAIPFVSSVVCYAKPDIGGAMMQMVAEIDMRNQKAKTQ